LTSKGWASPDEESLMPTISPSMLMPKAPLEPLGPTSEPRSWAGFPGSHRTAWSRPLP
jgi:hypothetical protein